MKRTRELLLITLAALLAIPLITMHDVRAGTKKYSVGDEGPAGGIIFYDKGDDSGGWRYLEAAPGDVCKSSRWHNGAFTEKDTGRPITTGATGTAIGTGKANTSKIIATYGKGIYAASMCANYRGGGKTDWFLPSKDELNMMYANLHRNKKGGFSDFNYWSSSESEFTDAWYQNFLTGEQSTSGKGFRPDAVRPVRSF